MNLSQSLSKTVFQTTLATMVDSQASSSPLILSIVGALMNKIKISMQYPKKNRLLAPKLQPTINLIAEQLLPTALARAKDD